MVSMRRIIYSVMSNINDNYDVNSGRAGILQSLDKSYRAKKSCAHARENIVFAQKKYFFKWVNGLLGWAKYK